jgi:hypothetical protein
VNGKVYFGSDDNKTYCLDSGTGAILWSYKMGGGAGTPAVADGKVYIGSMDYKIYCLDADVGKLIWSGDTRAYVGASPAIANGVLYAASFSMLFAFGGSSVPAATPCTSPSPTIPPMNTPTPTPTLEPTSTPTSTSTIQVTTTSGKTLNFTTYGNISASQISNAHMVTNQSAQTTNISFTLTGESGTIGFSNITIPNGAVAPGSSLRVFIDSQPAENQGFIQNNMNYYVWYTTHFSSHQIAIVFNTDSTPTPTAISDKSAGQISLMQIIEGAAAAIVIVGIIVGALMVANREKR